MVERALVIFSGGQDSTTCLAWAIDKWGYKNVETITFNYGSRHNIEVDYAKEIADIAGVPNFVHGIGFLHWNKNALTDERMEIEETETVPNTFVPYRNVHFLLIAATFARSRGINHLVTGVCQTDFSGYKDCRDLFIKSFEVMINEADDYPIRVHTPLMWLSKAESILLMKKLGRLEWLGHTHTCYKGGKLACRVCPACKLRLKGFKEAGIVDPISYEKN